MRNRIHVLLDLKNAVAAERQCQVKVLELLCEVERDRHFLEMGYPSLFEFATKELNYSTGAAYRRIHTMRLLKTMPEMKEKIADGSLSLCVAAKMQTVFRAEEKRRKNERVKLQKNPVVDKDAMHTREENASVDAYDLSNAECHVQVNPDSNLKSAEPLTAETKNEIMQSMLGVSARECEEKTADLFSELAAGFAPRNVGGFQERVRYLPEGRRSIEFVVDTELFEKFERLKGLLAHQNPGKSYAGLFDVLSDMALKKIEKVKPSVKAEVQMPTESEQQVDLVKNAHLVGDTLECHIPTLEKSGDLNGYSLDDVTLNSTTTRFPTLESSGDLNGYSLDDFSLKHAKSRIPMLEKKVDRTFQFKLSKTTPSKRQSIAQCIAMTKRNVWIRDHGRCAHRDEITGRVCQSEYALEFDHIHPRAWGGEFTEANLQILCRSHNAHKGAKPVDLKNI